MPLCKVNHDSIYLIEHESSLKPNSHSSGRSMTLGGMNNKDCYYYQRIQNDNKVIKTI